MTVDDIDTFPQRDGSEIWKERKEVGEGGRGSYCGEWYIVHLETGGQPPYAHPVRRVTMTYDYDLLQGDESMIGREKVGLPYGPSA